MVLITQRVDKTKIRILQSSWNPSSPASLTCLLLLAGSGNLTHCSTTDDLIPEVTSSRQKSAVSFFNDDGRHSRSISSYSLEAPPPLAGGGGETDKRILSGAEGGRGEETKGEGKVEKRTLGLVAGERLAPRP